jgi:hypothetical protein
MLLRWLTRESPRAREGMLGERGEVGVWEMLAGCERAAVISRSAGLVGDKASLGVVLSFGVAIGSGSVFPAREL